MSRELRVVAFATTAKNINEITTDNTLFVVDNPNHDICQVYWKGRRVTDMIVQGIADERMAAVVTYQGRQVELGVPGVPFVYDGQTFRKPTSWTVTFDEDSDTITR